MEEGDERWEINGGGEERKNKRGKEGDGDRWGRGGRRGRNVCTKPDLREKLGDCQAVHL